MELLSLTKTPCPIGVALSPLDPTRPLPSLTRKVWSHFDILIFNVFFLSVNSYIKSMEGKMEPVLKEKVWLSEEEMEKLGKRDQERYPPLYIYIL